MRQWEMAKWSRWGQLGEVAHWREALEGWTLSSAPSSPSPCSHLLPMAVTFPPQLRLEVMGPNNHGPETGAKTNVS